MLLRGWEVNLDGLAVETDVLGLIILVDNVDRIGWFEFVYDEVVVLVGINEGFRSEENFEGIFSLQYVVVLWVLVQNILLKIRS